MKLKYKLPLILFIAFIVIAAGTFTVSLTNSARLRQSSQYEMGRSMAEAKAEIMKGFLEVKVAELRAFDKDVAVMMNYSDKEKEATFCKLAAAFADQPSVSDVYLTFERGAYFSADSTKPGFYYNIDAFRSEKGSIEVSVARSEPVNDDDDWYNVPKNTMKTHLTEPYTWTYPGETRERKMITLSVPIIINDKFIGVLGLDMELMLLQKEIFGKMMNESTGAYAILVSHEGLRAVHPREEMLMVEIGHDMEAGERQALKDAIRNGEYRRVLKKNNQTGDFSLISYVPMQPAGIDLPWSLGYIVSLAVVQAEGKRIQNNTIMIGFFCAVAWGVFLLVFMSAIFGKVTRTVEAMNKMSEGDGDLTIRLEERGRDELGQMARGLNKLMDKLHATIKMTQEETKNLSNTSAALLELSHELLVSSESSLEQSESASHESEETSENVHEIASEAERASANATELSATADEMGTNLGSVVKAVDEMNESISKITDDARISKRVAGEAIEKVADAKSVMDALGASAHEIGQFTEVIKGIARKTNLLALNATVEAARAGDAGKGFAVVASEVKQLANQSAENANDITRRIENIQAGTDGAIDVISEISHVMKKISESANSISESIERQTKVSGELAGNIRQTNAGAEQVVHTIGDIANSISSSAQNAGEAAHGAKSVSQSISVIHEDAKKTNANSTELKEAATTLADMAERIDSIVRKFKT